MATVETVNGPVDVDELGLTLIHEHFRATDEATRFQFPHMYDEAAEWEAAMADANGVKSHGVRTVVEPSAMFLHRDAAFSRRVADESEDQPDQNGCIGPVLQERPQAEREREQKRQPAPLGRRGKAEAEAGEEEEQVGDQPHDRLIPGRAEVESRLSKAGQPGLEPGITGFGDRGVIQFCYCPLGRS